MNFYNLDKGVNNDINGDVLRNWLNTNGENIHNLIIKDKGIATIENIVDLFYNCSNLQSVDFSNFNTNKITSLYGFCRGIDTLTNISNFKTSNVTNTNYMFERCYNLTSIPNFDMGNVTSAYQMFAFCNNLTSIPNFDTSNVTDMARICNWCTNLVDVPQLNTSNVTGMYQAFCGCDNLSNASVQNIINMCLNSNVTDSQYMNLSNEDYFSPLCGTKFNTMYYANRQEELTAAGWSFEPYTVTDNDGDIEF